MDGKIKEVMGLVDKYGSAVESTVTGNPKNHSLYSDENYAYQAIESKLRELATGGQGQADSRDASRLKAFAIAGAATDDPSEDAFGEGMSAFREQEDGEDPVDFLRGMIDAGIAAQASAIAAAKEPNNG